MSKIKPNIGYACMNEDIHPNVYKTCRKDSITNNKLRELIQHNLEVLEKTIDYNIKNNNKMFRVSSSLIPFGSSPLNTLNWAEEFKKHFSRISTKIKNHKIRISVHPGQYTVLNSPNKEVVNNAILDLEYHTLLLDLLAPVDDSVIVLHVGGVYDDKKSAILRFIDTYNDLSDRIKYYLTIENDDRLYTVEDTLSISSKTGVPVIFDNLHHSVNPSLEVMTMKDILTEVSNTWTTRECLPKMHYSQQDTNKRQGAHSETINLSLFLEDYKKIYNLVDTDIMLEVKDKNRSFIRVNLLFNYSQKIMEEEWARYKYWVMARSQKDYNHLREMFSDNNEIDVEKFYSIIDSLTHISLDIKSQRNALHHIAGYFKDVATNKEKDKYLTLIDDLKFVNDLKPIYNYFKKLSKKYEVDYLLHSYFFD